MTFKQMVLYLKPWARVKFIIGVIIIMPFVYLMYPIWFITYPFYWVHKQIDLGPPFNRWW
jgi:hypothetical protein